MPFSSVNEAPMRFSRTDWLSGGRAVGETREASQSRLRAASLCAGASRPSAGAGVRRRYGFLQLSFSILCAQVRRVLVSGRMLSMASSCLRECGNLPAKAANSLPQAVVSTHLPAHRENVLHYWPQAASLATGNLRVPLVPRNRNRGLHSFPIQVPYLQCSKAWSRSGYV